VCGFHAPGSWERIEPLDDCLLASERGNAVRGEVLAWCSEAGLEPFDRRTREGVLRNLVVREGRRTGQVQVRLITTPKELDLSPLAAVADSVWWTQTDAVSETTSAGHTQLIAGPPRIEERIGLLSLQLSPEAFLQVNTEMAELLYARVADASGLEGWERVWDLYCGIGSIGLSLAPRAAGVLGLEVSAEAVADARRNATHNEITNATFEAADVRLALRPLLERSGRPDVIVVDPPRAGLSAKIVRRLIEAAPARIVYVSCNPTTLAPNAAQLVEAGYTLDRVIPIDMFPQTPHIECVAVLRRT
jgi:23S rRNA (uracil1939-C5)-methyltransferase